MPGRFPIKLCRPLSLEFLLSADLWYVTWLHCIAQEPLFRIRRALRGHVGTRSPTCLHVLCTCLAPLASKWFQDFGDTCSPSVRKPLLQW